VKKSIGLSGAAILRFHSDPFSEQWPKSAHNTLDSSRKKHDGWRLLFDGEDLIWAGFSAHTDHIPFQAGAGWDRKRRHDHHPRVPAAKRSEKKCGR